MFHPCCSIASVEIMAKKYGRWTVSKASQRKGGQSSTYRVTDVTGEMPGEFMLKRFNTNRIVRARNEIETLRRLSHPRIIEIIDSDFENDPPFLVSRFYARGELTQQIVQGKDLIERLTLFHSICEGVGYAHEQGVIHRDIKPANIFISDDDTPVIGDFGLCFLTDVHERFTAVDEAVGARWFMAPELASGRAHDVRPACDVYSLGKLLYWMLAGRVFDRERHREPEWQLSSGVGDVETEFINELLDGALNPEPTQRIRRGSSLAQEVKELISRIQKLRRTRELAGWRESKGNKWTVNLAQFRLGSLVKNQTIEFDDMCPVNVAANDRQIVVAGRQPRNPGDIGDNLEIGIGPSCRQMFRAAHERAGAIEFGLGRAVANQPSGHALIAFVEQSAADASRSLVLMEFDSNGRIVTETCLHTGVVQPRYVSFATGPNGALAYYLGACDSKRLDSPSEVIIRRDGAEHIEAVSIPSNLPSPMEFDLESTLHQVYVTSSVEANRESRRMMYRMMRWDGEMREETVASSSRGDAMSAYLGFAVTNAGIPIVLSNWSQEPNRQALMIHKRDVESWSQKSIDMAPFNAEFYLRGMPLGGNLQLLVDEQDGLHIAVCSDSGGQNILYLHLDEGLSVIERRVFSVQGFFGMSLDDRGGIFIASN